MSIPAKLHFCWIGTRLPWAYIFGLLSAAEHSDMPEIFLHHTDRLEDGAGLSALEREDRIKRVHLDPQTLLLKVGAALAVGRKLLLLHESLQTTVARADVLRAAILYLEGGIYLDLDTVTVASLLPLLTTEHFVGSERIVWPQAARASRAPAVLARHLALDIIRKMLKSLPQGWRGFRRMERYYVLGLNNAAFGCVAGSALMAEYLHGMLDLPLERQAARYALGPRLLQDVVERHGQQDVCVHTPEVFSPLPPEISEHWFRHVGKPEPSEILTPNTRVVHWYASVRRQQLVDKISPFYVMENRGRQLYSALICSYVQGMSRFAADAAR